MCAAHGRVLFPHRKETTMKNQHTVSTAASSTRQHNEYIGKSGYRSPEPARIILGKTADGAIVIDRPNSHLHEEVAPILADALSRLNTCNSPFIEVEVDFNRIIGKTICVKTNSNDRIVYAQRVNRNGFSRFVLDRSSEPSSKVTVVLKKTNKTGEYLLITAFIGSKPEVEPWDQRATSASFVFWQNHALVLNEELSACKGSFTELCPW